MAGSTRGFFGRARKQDPRLPPGQYDVGSDWPVLTAEVTPRIVPERWSITVDGLVVDARRLPMAIQRLAVAKGLIPYVNPSSGEDPADSFN